MALKTLPGLEFGLQPIFLGETSTSTSTNNAGGDGPERDNTNFIKLLIQEFLDTVD